MGATMGVLVIAYIHAFNHIWDTSSGRPNFRLYSSSCNASSDAPFLSVLACSFIHVSAPNPSDSPHLLCAFTMLVCNDGQGIVS